MTSILLAVHILVVIALVVVVLMQRSDGAGGLGMGGGGGGAGGFMSGRGAATALTRTTMVLSAAFFVTSISLAIFAERGETVEEVSTELTGEKATEEGGLTSDDLLNRLGDSDPLANQPEAPDTGDLLDALGDAPVTEVPAPATETIPVDPQPIPQSEPQPARESNEAVVEPVDQAPEAIEEALRNAPNEAVVEDVDQALEAIEEAAEQETPDNN